MTMLRVSVEGIAVCGPGLADWDAARPGLTGAEPYRRRAMELEPPPRLSPAERRRAIASVKLALAVGAGAVEQSGLDPLVLPAVFAASGADGDTISAILAALATPAREVSPTRFHNSVHNAPSGYWGVAMESREAVTSLSAHDASFAAGLLEAGVQAVSADRAVLLVAYDLPYPEPLHGVRPIFDGFGVALVLAPRPSPRSRGELLMRRVVPACGPASRCVDPGLETLRVGNPAARSLPLLAMLAAGGSGIVHLDHQGGTLRIEVVAC